MHMYTCLLNLWQTLSIKNTLRVLFLFFVSHVVVHRESGMKMGKTSERELESVRERKREKLDRNSKISKMQKNTK